MTQADDTILEFMANHPNDPLVVKPKTVTKNTGYSESTTRRRMRKLLKAGLLEYEDESGGYYEITDLGLRYLTGEADHSEIPDDIG